MEKEETILLLIPCIKYKDASKVEQMNKLMEEIREVDEACDNFSNNTNNQTFENLTMEIADVIVCCTTFLRQLGLNELQRRNVYKKVYDKNFKRGYYDGYKQGD